MKKILSLLLALLLFAASSVSLAEDMSIQLIGGPEKETEPVSLDDVKLEADIEIPGFGTINPTYYSVFNVFLVNSNKMGSNGYNRYDHEKNTVSSGNEAEFIVLFMDILNTTTKEKDYLTNYQVQVFFDEEYIYGGWAYQFNYDCIYSTPSRAYPDRWANRSDDGFAIKPMYQGHYVFGCTLPNAVINSKKPLRMVITIDGNEITYNVRK